MDAQKPSVGRIVHYHREKTDSVDHPLEEPVAAIITRVWSDTCVNLTLFADGRGEFKMTSVCLRDEQNTEGVWSWPPRV